MMAVVDRMEDRLCTWLKQIRDVRAVVQDSCGLSGHGPWLRERDSDCHSLGWFEECQSCGYVRRA